MLSVHCLYQARRKSARGYLNFRTRVYRDGTDIHPLKIPPLLRGLVDHTPLDYSHIRELSEELLCASRGYEDRFFRRRFFNRVPNNKSAIARGTVLALWAALSRRLAACGHRLDTLLFASLRVGGAEEGLRPCTELLSGAGKVGFHHGGFAVQGHGQRTLHGLLLRWGECH